MWCSAIVAHPLHGVVCFEFRVCCLLTSNVTNTHVSGITYFCRRMLTKVVWEEKNEKWPLGVKTSVHVRERCENWVIKFFVSKEL